MTMHVDDIMHGLTSRAATDGVIVTIGGTMNWWLDALHGPAQELAFWGTVALVVGRLVLLALDFRDRLWPRPKPSKVFTREHFGDDASPKP
ncbi:hypothetical protein [Azospirillum sp. TSH64]|uniref:hypothetical protein n=1 Tax=Azospirillum sp. TSH64 TaxID=652740 RepID=UPI000D60A845|nr:hypothetical protein [Azospirillum sp. TSH64]PWC74046.1 hypothetical protein TSH64_02565 [Azospirillum sp. TSH64]